MRVSVLMLSLVGVVALGTGPSAAANHPDQSTDHPVSPAKHHHYVHHWTAASCTGSTGQGYGGENPNGTFGPPVRCKTPGAKQ